MIEKYSNFNPEFKAIICNNIKVYRKEKGVRLMDLAEILDASPEYLAKSINKSRSSFQILEVQTNNKNVVKGLLDFYNAQITLVGQGNLVRISYKEGINGLIIQNRSFINDLYLKSER